MIWNGAPVVFSMRFIFRAAAFIFATSLLIFGWTVLPDTNSISENLSISNHATIRTVIQRQHIAFQRDDVKAAFLLVVP